MRLGKQWEALSRKWLQQNYPGFYFAKLINPMRIDWCGIGPNNQILLVESKHCRQKNAAGQVIYYAKANKRKREQLQEYFRVKKLLTDNGYKVTVALLLCKGPIDSPDKQVLWEQIDTYDDVKTTY